MAVFASLFSRAEGLAAKAREVQESADEFTTLTDVAPIGIFRTDAGNRYIYTSPTWSEITGVRMEEALGRE